MTKFIHGWHFPDHEVHLVDWVAANGGLVLNGRKSYQGSKQLLAMRHCRSFHTAVDVGAHIGFFSYNLAQRFEVVHAFEPVAEHRECFAKNVTADEVVLHDCALGAAPGWVSMSVTPGSSGDSKVASGQEVTDSTHMRTLDSFNIRNVDFIKVDCEGYEENVLRGAEQTILQWKPTIIVEQKREMATRFGLQPLGAVEYLKGLGYKQVAEHGGDFVLVPA
jgi:FkbM family methyltransferase